MSAALCSCSLTECALPMQCVYELDVSLVKHTDTEYLFDMYTVTTGTMESSCAVGICTGLAAVDYNTTKKWVREEHFPFELLEDAISFHCSDGEASMPVDKDRILLAIGDTDQQQLLDATVHGRVAAVALSRALAAGADEFGNPAASACYCPAPPPLPSWVFTADGIRCEVQPSIPRRTQEKAQEKAEQFLQAIAAGRLQRLEVSLQLNAGDTVGNMRQLVEALDCETLQELTITYARGSWSRAGDWLREALGNRKFDKLTKIDLNSKSFSS